jgi:hypothetical protein
MMATLFSFGAMTLSFLATSSRAFTATTTTPSTSTGYDLHPCQQRRFVSTLRTGSNLWMSSIEDTSFDLDPEETGFVFIEYQNEFATVSLEQCIEKQQQQQPWYYY